MSKKESHWFSHDHNAAQDPKLIALATQYGMTGYGRWWRLLEILRGEDQYKYCITTRFAYSVLARELMCTQEEARQFVADCINEYELLQTDDEYIWSASLQHRMTFLDNKRERYSEMGKKGAATTNARRATKLKENTNTAATMLQPTDNETTTMSQENTTNNNNKQQITTEEETTAITEQNENLAVVGGEVNILEQYRTQALDDDMHFVYPIVSAGRATKEQLGEWLIAFNRILAFRADTPATQQDYRRHFANWFKFRDPQREDPHSFAALPAARNKAPATVQPFLKTPEQVQAEQAARRNEWKERVSR
jgi:hypothetical protein